jgi:hypothetical protein
MKLCRLEQLPHDSTRRQLVQMFIHLRGGGGGGCPSTLAALLPGNCSFSPQFVCRPLFVVPDFFLSLCPTGCVICKDKVPIKPLRNSHGMCQCITSDLHL